MKKTVFIFAALCAAAFVSCSPKELVIDNPNDIEQGETLIPITITASLEGTKADMLGTAWTWKEGDKLAVYDGTAKREFTLDASSAGAAVAKFTGSVSSTENLKAVFPYEAASDSFAAPLVPTAQIITSGTLVDPAAMIAVAEKAEKVEGSDDEFNFYFTSAAGLLRFTVGDGVKRVILHTLGEETIAGDSRSVAIDVPAAGQFWAIVNPAAYDGLRVFVRSTGGDSLKETDKTIDLSSADGTVKAKNLGTVCGGTDVCVIENGDDMVKFLSGSDARDAYLCADIDLDGKTITSRASFANVFDGQGYILSNIVSDSPLFDNNTGTIKNLELCANCSFVSDADYFAPVARENSGTIENVANRGNVSRTLNEAATASFLYAGIVAKNSGTLRNCENYGSVSVSSSSSIIGSGVAGIVAYSSHDIEDCTNGGSISLSSAFTSAKSDKSIIVLADAAAPALGGVVAYMYKAKITGCRNEGVISWTQNAIDYQPNDIAMNAVGGIAGVADGNVVSCINDEKGSIKISHTKATRGVYSDKHSNLHVGGICGRNGVTTASNSANITSCTNNAEITFDCDATKAYSAVGGIIGWPSTETNPTVKTSDCSSDGNIIVKGVSNTRVGGIHGSTGNVEKCTFSGNITSVQGNGGGIYIGGISGYRNVKQTMKDCVVDGSTLQYTGTTAGNSRIWGIGGLVGNVNNAAGHCGGDGCTVLCHISSNHPRDLGIIAGRVGADSSKNTVQAVSFGTESSPITVKKGSSITCTSSSRVETVDSSNYNVAILDNGSSVTPVINGSALAATKSGFLFGALWYNSSKHTYHVQYAE